LSELTPHPAVHYVYVLKNNRTHKLYYGYTNNLKRRIVEHENEMQSWELIYYEAYKAEADARNREKRLKNYAQALTALKARLKESFN
jgi:putative endonuclease